MPSSPSTLTLNVSQTGTVFSAVSLVVLAAVSFRAAFSPNVGYVPRRRTKLADDCVLDPANKAYKKAAPAPTAEDKAKKETHDKRSDVDAVWFAQVNKHDSAWVGGKGANLGELASNGFPVPPGFCITKRAFDAHLSRSGGGAGGKSLLERIEAGTLTTKEAHAAVLSTEMDPALVVTVKKMYAELGAGKGLAALVAVRSSATAEDSADASFAGQLDTFLGVRGEEQVLKAIKECWASLYSERVEAYRKLAGKARGGNAAAGGNSVSCCVVVQIMIDADAAGVLFTANPFTQARDETVVTANFGIGESVVADIATPDTFVVKAGAIIKRTVAVKEKKVVLNPELANAATSHGRVGGKDAGTSVVVDIAEAERSKPCLTDAEIISLAALGDRVKKHYENHPQDMEFGIKDGVTYLLQARPITTLGVESNGSEEEKPATIDEFDAFSRPTDWITTCNAAEMFPGAMTPLTISLFGRISDEGVQRMQIDFGVRDRIDYKNKTTMLISGNLFINFTNTIAPMAAGMVGAQMAKDNGEMSVLGKKNEGETMENLMAASPYGRGLFFPFRLMNGARFSKTILLAPLRIPKMQARIRWATAALLNDKVASQTAAEQWALIDSWLDAYDDQWSDGIVTSATSGAVQLGAMKLLVPAGKDAWGTQTVSEFATLMGERDDDIGTAESAGAVEFLDEMRVKIAAWPVDKLQAFAAAAIPDALATLQADPVVGKILRDLLEQQGHRCVKEAEMRERDWAQDPSPLVRILQAGATTALKAAGKPEKAKPASSAAKNAASKSAAEEIIASKKHLNFLTRPLLRFFVRLTRTQVHLRENGKSLQVKLNSVFKRAYHRLALKLADEGRLSDPDLAFFLTHQELGRLASVEISNRSVHALRAKALQRRRLLATQKTFKFPELTLGKPSPMQPKSQSTTKVAQMTGTPVSSGMARGFARVARTVEDAEKLEEGEILITTITDVGWTPFFSMASGLVTEIGGMLSHGAVVAREYSLPCVVGVEGACDSFVTGQLLELDGDKGIIRVLQG